MAFNLFNRKDPGQYASKLPLSINTEFVPYKLKAREKSSSTLIIRVKNLSDEPILSSVSVALPGQISLDEIGLEKRKDVKIGELNPKEEKESKIEIHSGVGTEKGDYTISLTAYVHYRDYSHVANAVKKRDTITAV